MIKSKVVSVKKVVKPVPKTPAAKKNLKAKHPVMTDAQAKKGFVKKYTDGKSSIVKKVTYKKNKSR